MDCVNFGEDKHHVYNEHHMRNYVRVTEVHDKHRGDNILTVSPEFSRIKAELSC